MNPDSNATAVVSNTGLCMPTVIHGTAKLCSLPWFDQIRGCSKRRQRYVSLYKEKLRADMNAVDDSAAPAPGTDPSAGGVTLSLAVVTEIDDIEVKQLTFEQVLLFRFLAEV